MHYYGEYVGACLLDFCNNSPTKVSEVTNEMHGVGWLIQNIARFLQSLTLHDGGSYHIQSSPLICRANQGAGFYMTTASVMKELKNTGYGTHCLSYKVRNMKHEETKWGWWFPLS